ncbi:hypothetical protein [Achromobacter agilis]|uniref:Uncharacterized protein n=1 Tax=Achromobacter agilis TaxID=1353888 RepID=A0A446CGA4_9BURK|nr:hypothetical protein [Achromobacter agilis]SSW66855.1 hypothetical protein AGI3411_02760 [Achromobacter agilis]
MTLHRPGLFVAAALALYALAAPRADAACNDKKIMAMAKDGRSAKTIAKACGMPAAKVRGVIEAQAEDDAPPAAAPAQAERAQRTIPAQRPAKTQQAEAADKLPSGSGLALCDCQGSVPYGDKAPELRCRSGTSIATPCAGYCPPSGIAPWRRICS